MFLFKPKKPEEEKKPELSQANIDLEIITNMNQEFALSLELKETLNTALKVIINRINAQAANIFLINDQKKKFECIASINQDYLDEYELNEGDLAVFVYGGHGYEILEDDTKIIETKNGPFTGVENDKVKF